MCNLTKQKDASQSKKTEQPMPVRYIVAILIMFSILVAAIIIPDLLPYLAPKLGSGVIETTTDVVEHKTNLPMPRINAFETYARLVTLFLAIVSVLGVFFGYFVRKSIRETEEDIEKRFDRNMDLWKKERGELLKQYEDDAKKLREKLAIVTKLEEGLREILETRAQEERHRAQSSEKPTADRIQDSAQQVDDQLADLTRENG